MLQMPRSTGKKIATTKTTYEAIYKGHSIIAQWFITAKNWATRLSTHWFAGTAQSFACPALLASLTRSAALIRSHPRSLTHSRARGRVNDWMSQNKTLWARIEKKHRINSHPIIHCPTSEGVSGANEQANERASSPVLYCGFLVILAHMAVMNW